MSHHRPNALGWWWDIDLVKMHGEPKIKFEQT
jgi:hypothetical protein